MQCVGKIFGVLSELVFANLVGGEYQTTDYYDFRFPLFEVYTPSLFVINLLYTEFNIIPYDFNDVYCDGRMERCFHYKLRRTDWTNDVD